jgi:hypothetical protein
MRSCCFVQGMQGHLPILTAWAHSQEDPFFSATTFAQAACCSTLKGRYAGMANLRQAMILMTHFH